MKVFATALGLLRLVFVTALVALGLSACGGGGGGDPTLQRIEISPATASRAAGTTQQYVATAIYSDNTKTDVSASSETGWVSSNPATATISSTGLAQTLKAGTVTISGTYRGVTGTATLTVTTATATALSVTPATASVAKGNSRAFTATATFTDMSTQDVTASAAWASSSPAVASVGNSAGNKGQATGVSEGSATITATYQGLNASGVLNVTAATLSSIEVTPANATLPKGASGQAKATGIYSDSSTQDLTTTVTWSSSNTDVATISNTAGSQGRATAVSEGTTTISASTGGVTGSTGLTVSAARLTSLEITPTNASSAKGTMRQFTATGTFSDMSTQDVTAEVVWSSSTETVATISNASGSSGLATAQAEGSTTIGAASGSVTASTSFTVTAAVLTELQITPTNSSRPKGTSQQFTATGIYSDTSTQDLTDSVVWSSTATDVASISNAAGSEGLASALTVGSTMIGAASGDISASTPFTVTDAVLVSLQVTPVNPSAPKGTTQQFTATGTYSDLSTQDLTTSVTWSSSASAVATISNASGSQGLASAATVGSTTIGAVSGDISASTPFTVTEAVLTSLQVTPVNPSAPKGTTQQFAATGTYSDMSTQDLTTTVTWTSSAPEVATISNAAGSKGLASAVAVGSTTVSATSGDISGSTPFTVTAAVLTSLQITPANASVAKGTAQQFTATGTYSDMSTQDLTTSVTWSSSTSGVATISNASGSQGLASTTAEGSTTIGAVSGDISTSTPFTVTAAVLSRIDVTPSEPSIPVNTTQQFKATGVFTDNSMQDLTASATWQSSDATVLDISNGAETKGFAVANKKGTATVSASYMSLTGSTLATVSDAALTSIAVTPANSRLPKGFQRQLTATGTYSDNSVRDVTQDVTWSSTAPTSVTVSNAAGSRGLATATQVAGVSNISATLGSVVGTTSLTVTSATLNSIAVTPANRTVPKGIGGQLAATGTFSDGSTQDLTSQASWSSSNTAAVTVDDSAGNKGYAQSVEVGSADISAAAGGKVGTTTVTVSAAALRSIAVTPAGRSIAKGTTQAYRADGTFTDNTVQDITTSVTWSSSNTSIASISNTSPSQGVAKGLAVGSTNISAARDSITGSTSLSVTAAELRSIAVTPATASIAAGRSQQFVATGTYTDDSTQVLTESVTWSSSDTAVATISNVSPGRGRASSTTKGETVITAASGAVVSPGATLTVTDAVPVSIRVTPANTTIPNKTSQQFQAITVFSDGSTSDQTEAVTWSSSNAGVASISNAEGSKGLANAIAVGGVTITATDGSINGSTSLTVAAASLQSIRVIGKSISIPAGYKVQYTAEGTYSDGSKQDVTASASWSALNTAVATVSNASDKGMVTTVAPGNTSIVASLGGFTASAPIAVNSATLSSITVTPANPTITGNNTLQFTATGRFSDSTTFDITVQVTWASSSPQTVSINATGLATGGTLPGNATISATKGSVSGQTTATHSPF